MYKQRVRPDGGIPPDYSGWTATRPCPCPDPPPPGPPPARPCGEPPKAPPRPCGKRPRPPFCSDSGDLILAAALAVLLFCGEEKPDLLTLGAILVLLLLR